MSAPSRSFFRRLALALLGMMMLVAVVFVALGWVVARHWEEVAKVIGRERQIRLTNWYVHFIVGLLPDDGDGDGVCDGAELYFESDPRNPTSRPVFLRHRLTTRGHSAGEIVYCGVRLVGRLVQDIDGTEVRWPKGFKAVVSASEPVLLLRDDAGSPTRGPVSLTANERGEVAFEIMAESAFESVSIVSETATDAIGLGQVFRQFPGWRTPPIPASINGGPARASFIPWTVAKGATDDEYEVKWSAPTGLTGDYVVEAAREGTDELWVGVRVVKSPETKMRFGSMLWVQNFSDYTGPLKLRVVPLSATHP